MNKKLVRLTESDLHRIIKESVNKVLNERIIDEEIDEGFGNWVRASIDGLSNIGNYSKGSSNSKLVNFTDNVSRTKQHFDDVDNVQRARKNGFEDASKIRMAKARMKSHRYPGQPEVSQERNREHALEYLNAKKANDRYNDIMKAKKYGLEKHIR